MSPGAYVDSDEVRTCPFCKEDFRVARGGYVNHERHCPDNPNAVKRKQRSTNTQRIRNKRQRALRRQAAAERSTVSTNGKNQGGRPATRAETVLDNKFVAEYEKRYRVAHLAKQFFPEGIATNDVDAFVTTLEWLYAGAALYVGGRA